VAVLSNVSQLEDRRQPTTTLEGWRRFVDTDPVDFKLLAERDWTALPEEQRVVYDEARIARHAELVVVTTSTIQEITNEGRLLTLMNQREIVARRGLIVSGIEVERTGLFTGVRGKQLAGRCALVNTGPFPFHDEWKQLVAGMESSVRLHRHEPGSLVASAKYLHQRTGGMIGSLSHLIRAAAIRAILSETEAITEVLMDRIRIDHAAESSARRTSSSR
jgi:hypothetical protein